MPDESRDNFSNDGGNNEEILIEPMDEDNENNTYRYGKYLKVFELFNIF